MITFYSPGSIVDYLLKAKQQKNIEIAFFCEKISERQTQKKTISGEKCFAQTKNSSYTKSLTLSAP